MFRRPSTAALFAAWVLLAIASPVAARAAEIETFFSPRGGATMALVNLLDHAAASIDVAAYQLTSRPLIDSLIAARQRGVAVRVIVDRSQESASHRILLTLRGPNLALVTDHMEKLHHNKYCIVDGCRVATGSFNWSDNAENKNAENLLIIHDQDVAAAFTADFNHHFGHSSPYRLKERTPHHALYPRATFFFSTTPPNPKGLLPWHALLVPSCQSMQAELSPAPSSLRNGKAATTRGNESFPPTRVPPSKLACAA